MPLSRTIPSALAVIAIATACHPATPPDGNDASNGSTANPPRGIVAGSLTASASTDGIALQNQTEWPLYYRVVVRDSANSVAACITGSGCPRLVQAERRTVSYSSVAGATSATQEFLVVWWQATRSSNGTENIGSAQTVVVRR